ncbi:hypothetical protein FJV76_08735 [Mesorhizobium sp. WSM4303]|nr:hypothetical protein FJV76_08735 [Mesorhizobium sp. WSM4303]
MHNAGRDRHADQGYPRRSGEVMSEPFKSFDALKSAYDALAGQPRAGSSDKDSHETAIRDFVEAAAQAGAFIEDPNQRRSAQDMLDYWFTHLLASSDAEMDVVSPRLADYRPVAEMPKGAAEPSAKTESQSDLERSRQIIRLGALARQWRYNDEAKGYLLKGAALEDAKQYSQEDRDIAALVAASEREERKSKNTWITALAVVAILLAVLAGIAILQARTATAQAKLAKEQMIRAEQNYTLAQEEKARADAAAKLALEEQKRADAAALALTQEQKNRAEEQRAEAEAQRRAAEAAAKASDEARLNAEKLAEQAKADTEALSKRFAELQKQQVVLDAAIEVIRKQLQSGELQRSELPEAIAELIKPDAVVDVFSDPSILEGYKSGFLGVDVALPALSETNRPLAFDGGRSLNYLNYSIVLNQQRRMAFYSAVNLDRDQLRVLPGRPFPSYPSKPDPRIPREVQLLPAWFVNPAFDVGHLAWRSEISWGQVLPAVPNTAAQILNDSLYVFTNITPQFDTFNQGIWAALDRWTLTKHNPDARQVTIFTGPVFATDDPVFNGVSIPRAFWKVVVSATPNYSQSAGPSSYVVDAFLISQFKPGTIEKVDLVRSFDPETYRVPVAEIESLTGLRFAEIIESTDRNRLPVIGETIGDVMASRVGLLDAPDAPQRKEVAQELVSALRDGAMVWSEQQKVISALLAMAQDTSVQKLSATGRLNLLFVLSQVPASTWDNAQAVDLKATARDAVAVLESRAAAGSTEIGAQTREHLARLETNIGYGKKSTQTVYLQFTGLTRNAAIEISSRMQQLGWNIPGEERVKEGANEVRFNPAVEADEEAAELLAADLRALGRTAVTAKGNKRIKSGNLEIYLSD